MIIDQEIKKLQLSKSSYMVVGSGILHVLGIRDSHDIDLIITDETFRLLGGMQSWRTVRRGDGTYAIANGTFDCMTDWYGKDLVCMLERAVYINDVPYMSLHDVYEWKRVLARDKDMADLRLIDRYLANANSSFVQR